MKFIGDFIGYENPNTTFTKNSIYYKYNKLGHRCKDVEDIDLDNYILFAGCSHTEGESLHIEHTYPFLTAQQLNCDYYNLGLSASGFDVVFYNLMSWLNSYKKPKFIVLQYPDQSRFSTIVNEDALIVPYGPWKTEEENISLIFKANEVGLFQFRNSSMVRLLNMYTIDIPTIKLVFGNVKPYDNDSVRIERLDYATDGIHYGLDTHTMCAETIHERIIQ